MTPEEPRIPKRAKVDPIDRRGPLAKIKGSRTKSAPLGARDSETPAQKIHRIKKDIAPDVQETREVIEHYLPFIELVEIEQVLAILLIQDGLEARNYGGLSEVLQHAAEKHVLNGESLRLCDDVRILRNALFHEHIKLTQEQSGKIDRLWKKIVSMSKDPPALAMEMKAALDLGERDIELSKPTLERVAPIAYLVETEQALKKVFDHLTKPLNAAPADARNYNNGFALLAIKESTGKISHALEDLGLVDDLRAVVGLRNKLLHLQAALEPAKDDLAKIERIWNVCLQLGRIIRIHQCLLAIEGMLRGILRPKTTKPEDLEFFRIGRLSKRAIEESSILHQPELGGVTRAMLKGISDFWEKAKCGTLAAPTEDDLRAFQDVRSKLQSAGKSSTRFDPLGGLTKSQKQALLEEEARQTKKKARKDYRD